MIGPDQAYKEVSKQVETMRKFAFQYDDGDPEKDLVRRAYNLRQQMYHRINERRNLITVMGMADAAESERLRKQNNQLVGEILERAYRVSNMFDDFMANINVSITKDTESIWR